MATDPTRPPQPPSYLRRDGKRWWCDVVSTYAFEDHELAVLAGAASTVEVLGRLRRQVSALSLSDSDTFRVLREERAQSDLLERTLKQLNLPVSLEVVMQRVNV